MANRTNIEFYSHFKKGWAAVALATVLRRKKYLAGLGAILHGTWRDSPRQMGLQLERMMSKAKDFMENHGFPWWWEGEMVAGLVIALSARKGFYGRVPAFQPCIALHPDVKYVWKVFVGPGQGQYEIQCFRAIHDKYGCALKRLKKVNWRKAAGL